MGYKTLVGASILLLVVLLPLSAYAETVLDNGYFVVSVEVDTGADGVGTFTVATGSSHPAPDQDVLYDGVSRNAWSSYVTIILPEYNVAYVQTTRAPVPPPGYTLVEMDDYVSGVYSDSGRVVINWTLPEGLLVTQEIILQGSTLETSRVVQKLTVTYTGSSLPLQGNDTITIGVRFMWDIMIDGEDGAVIRLWGSSGPVSDWLTNETELDDVTGITYWEATNDPSSPIFYIWGSLTSPSEATPPDRFVFAGWPKLFDNAWNVTVDPTLYVAGDDTAVAYYWENVTLAAGESVTFVQFILPVTIEETPPPETATPSPYYVVGGELVVAPTPEEGGVIAVVAAAAALGVGVLLASRVWGKK